MSRNIIKIFFNADGRRLRHLRKSALDLRKSAFKNNFTSD